MNKIINKFSNLSNYYTMLYKLAASVGKKDLKLSDGQIQRLAIAIASYKKSKLIIFDEAISSLDLDSENCILYTIFNLNKKDIL